MNAQAETELWLIPPEEIAGEWPLVSADVRAACDESDGELDEAGVYSALASGETALWMVVQEESYRGVVVAELTRSGLFNIVLTRLHPGGPHDTLAAVLGKLGALARENFHARLSAWSCRPGMARLLGRLGWQPRFVEYLSP